MTKKEDKNNFIIPLFPLPEVVFFPGMNMPLHIFEEKYKTMILKCLEGNKQFGIVLAQDNLCAEIGTIAEILDVEKLEEGKMNVLAEGRKRFKIINFLKEEPYHIAEVQNYNDTGLEIDPSLKKSIRQIKRLSQKALRIFDKVSDQDLSKKLKLPEEPSELMFLITANLSCPVESKQSILETNSVKDRVEKVMSLLKEEIERLEVLLENKKTKDVVVKNGKLSA